MFILDCWKKNISINPEEPYGRIVVRMPARFDFIGGWTDTPPYYFDNDGCVLNTTVKLNCPEHSSHIEGIEIEIIPSESFMITENGHSITSVGEHLVLKKTLEFLGLDSPLLSLSIRNHIPKESGLGGSSLLVASFLAALIGYYKGIDYVKSHLNDLINAVLMIEQKMTSGGGWQDQIGGIFPGVKLIETSPNNPCRYTISYLGQPLTTLNDNSLIIDTRIHRKAVKILSSIRQKYIERDPKTVKMLLTITSNARRGFAFLNDNNIPAFAELLSESWRLVNEVESCSVETVDTLKKVCGNDLTGVKIGGAGGGGFILAIFNDSEKKLFYKKKIIGLFQQCCVYEPEFGCSGMSLSQTTTGKPDESLSYHVEPMTYV